MRAMTKPSLAMLLTCLTLAAAARVGAQKEGHASRKVRVYVGTYTGGGQSKGIYRLQLDLATGVLSVVGEPTEAVNPSFLALHPSGRFLYAVAESGDARRGESGAVAAFAVDGASGALSPLNQKPSGGAGPCHISMDKQGRHVLVANYGGGSVAVLPVQRDGRLGDPSAVVQHEGSSVNPERQKGPHAHSINLDAADRFAFAADLGLDKLLVYRFDAKSGGLTAHEPAKLAPGSGPRHFAFHPGGAHAYVINELTSTITAFAYDAAKGALSELQTVSTLPSGFEGRNSTAEVVVRPDGRFVYGSNRGHDSIAIFRVDPGSGKLTAAGHQATLGKTPRNFAIDPTGSFLLAANQNSDSVAVFRIDASSGGLEPIGSPLSVPRPVCLRMVRIAD
jgi:6-phosphogluconolactonase